jgi:hypothetical protein
MKMKSLIIALAVFLLIVPSAVYASTVDVTGQATVLPGESFFVDVLLTGGITNPDVAFVTYYSFVLGLFGPSDDASIEDTGEYPLDGFIQKDYTTGEPDYLFSSVGTSIWTYVTPTTVGDQNTGPPLNLAYDTPGTPNPRILVNPEAAGALQSSSIDPGLDYLLAQVLIEIDPAAEVGQVFNFGWVPGFDAANEIGNSIGFKENLDYASSYSFEVVPIPAAAWLLGAGLLGLVGLRRKSS